MARLPDAWLDEMRSRVDIVDVVSDYVALKPKGRRYWGLCPFHNEKTASFSVDADAQMYYCFGCHKGGNVIHFVMEQERMEFMDAVRLLAERAHMDLPEREPGRDDGADRQLRDSIFDANVAAARFYHAAIWTEEGAKALAYLHRRGLDDQDIRKFGLGSTKSGWDALTAELTKQGFSREVLTKAGLSSEKDGRAFDMFRDRVMFPIINQQGRVLGFGGRIMGDGNPKYLNTPDTPVFNKRNGLYAMNFVRKERNISRAILVEGYMDVVSLRRQGVEGVVATLGTALTEEQARLIKRYAPETWVAYDGDEAGQKAIVRALDIMEGQGVKCRVLAFPEGLDPDEFISQRGRDAFSALKPLDPFEYRMQRLKQGVDMASEEGRTNYAIACCGLLKRVRNPVELENHVKRLAMQTGFDRDVLLRQIGVAVPEKSAFTRKTPARDGARREADNECTRAERTLVMLLGARLIPTDAVKPQDFETRLYADMARMLAEGVSAAALLDKLPEEDRERAARALNDEAPPTEKNALAVAEDCLRRIRVFRIERNIAQLEENIKSAQDEDRRECMTRMMDLTRELDRLKSGRKEWVV